MLAKTDDTLSSFQFESYRLPPSAQKDAYSGRPFMTVDEPKCGRAHFNAAVWIPGSSRYYRTRYPGSEVVLAVSGSRRPLVWQHFECLLMLWCLRVRICAVSPSALRGTPSAARGNAAACLEYARALPRKSEDNNKDKASRICCLLTEFDGIVSPLGLEGNRNTSGLKRYADLKDAFTHTRVDISASVWV
jgi:hypothetical protein